MKQIVRDYFTFNKRERNGVFVLIAIITGLLVYLNISENFQEPQKVDVSRFIREIDSLNAMQPESPGEDLHENAVKSLRPDNNSTSIAERFVFDPNNLPAADWKRLGFTEKQIKSIKNYEEKGGKFRKKEDLKKMYCIKPEQYASLERYIEIQPAPSVFENGKVAAPKAPAAEFAPKIVELNSADSAMLTTVKGIGPFFAKQIIKYRNSLGGFHSKEQLMEVWKFDAEKFAAVEKFVSVDPAKVRKININTCEAEALKTPYIKWNVAKAIVNYRKQHGKFKTIEEIKNTDLVDGETLRKIAPYLTVE
jgi:competence ComEA-like helix-hairpin-helix protein